MGRWCDGRCQEVGGGGNAARNRDSWQKEGLGSKGAVVPMMMMMMIRS